MITNINQLDLNKRYTYADYLKWRMDDMVELIKGKVFKMSPAPNLKHQEVSGNLYLLIGNHLKNKKCKAFHAPFDVRLPLPPKKQSKKKIDTVVQPDICVICDLSKLDTQGCNGAPDWIIEILSRSTAQKDLTEKFDIYQNASVKEYWIVHPEEGTLLVYVLNKKGKYEAISLKPFVRGEKVAVDTFKDLWVDLDEVFPDDLDL